MREKSHSKQPFVTLLFILLSVFFLTGLGNANGQSTNTSDLVSIQVDGGTIRQVLNAFAIQTKRNVVIGPDVTNDVVTIHLTEVRWNNALDVILKPYDYGYREVGNTIVISRLDKLAALQAVEPLETRVFTLKFLDAGDVKEMLEEQLSVRGSMSIMKSSGQKGWEFATQNRSYSRSGASLSKRERLEDADQTKSKTIIVSDIPGVLENIESVLDAVDQMPEQILVEAKFIEVNDNYLKDIGVELSGSLDIGGSPIGLADRFFDATPNAFSPASSDISAKRGANAFPLPPLNTFGAVTFDSGSFDLLLSLLQEDDDSKVLSAPSVLTLNNQEATIIVGEKFPIIESDVSGSGGDAITSTTLDYYENIGIQLNVVPQISGVGYVNMIVHPSVSTIVGFENGAVSQGDADQTQSLTRYPRINTREAETQILLRNTETIVIGGLLEERETHTELKVPFLGDIPILGWLFKRDTGDTKTVDLLIFISATIINGDNYDMIIKKKEAEEVDEVLVVDLSENDEPIDMETALPETPEDVQSVMARIEE